MTEADQKAGCDLIVERAAEMMHTVGAPPEMIIDRLITYAAAQACLFVGSDRMAIVFREVADAIEGGMFHSVTGEGQDRH